jgi:NADPH-dependent 2,4-dienoyl-CoA reductase/sulfur reductase-like enzyme
VRKTREGRVDEVRPCIACNQGCVGGLLSAAMRLGCAVNPAVGFELTLSEDLIVRTPRPKRVLVVGGGPGGLEAARVAALAGHRVSLFEAGSSLGGTVNIAKLAPKMHTFGDITNWLEREVERLGVEVRTSTYVDAADVLAEKPDAVIVATGARPRMDGVQVAIPAQPTIGVEQSHVLSSTDLLTDRGRTLGGHALVFDDVGGYEAVAAADFLIERGVAVTFATRCSSFAPIVDTWTRAEPALERLHAGRFRLVTRAHLVEVRPRECVIRPLQGSEHEVVARGSRGAGSAAGVAGRPAYGAARRCAPSRDRGRCVVSTRSAGGDAGGSPGGAVDPVTERDYDVVVVGGGGAGLAAALAARESGESVLIIEAGDKPGGSSAMSGGVVYAAGPAYSGLPASAIQRMRCTSTT